MWGIRGVGTSGTSTVTESTVDSVDRTRLNGYELVRLVQLRSALISRMQAELFADMVELAHVPPGGPDAPVERQQEPYEFATDELGAALSWTRPAADRTLDLAWRLVERLPRVWKALHRGVIDVPKARTIVYGTDHLDVDYAREVADVILPDAGRLTTGQIAARLRRLCAEVDPDDAKKRYEEGVEDRRVVAEPNPDGTGDLFGINLPGDRVAAIIDRIASLARERKTKDETRTVDQLRADIFLEILEGRHTADPNRRPMVDIRVGLDTLVGLNERAGEIPGWGPVIADIARQAVQRQPNGEWRVVVTDPDTGAVLWDGTTRRRPTAAQRRYVEARRPTCTFKGCRRPARRADIDHLIEVSKGGTTIVTDLHPLCRHHHRLRHESEWRIEQPEPGVYIWISPHGHRYQTGNDPPE